MAAVVWATGFRPDFTWIQLPIFDAQGYPLHERGLVAQAPGLYFLGLHFQTALSSGLIAGVGRDAYAIARHIAGHTQRQAAYSAAGTAGSSDVRERIPDHANEAG